MAKRDYYETLGISKGASETDIKKAFRLKAREHHPDKNAGSSKAEEEFKAVNEAYEVLKDPSKKAAYDQYGHAAFENGGFGNAGGGGGDPTGGGSRCWCAAVRTLEPGLEEFGNHALREAQLACYR